MILTALGVGLGWIFACQSSCTVTTVSNLKMPYIVMFSIIALYHSGVGAVVSSVPFFMSPSCVYLVFVCSFLTLF